MNNPVFQSVRGHAGEQLAYFTERPKYPVLAECYLDDSMRNLRAWLEHRDEDQKQNRSSA